jgi:hypothetical protein
VNTFVAKLCSTTGAAKTVPTVKLVPKTVLVAAELNVSLFVPFTAAIVVPGNTP